MKITNPDLLIDARKLCIRIIHDLPAEALPETISVLRELERAYDKSVPPLSIQ